MEMEEEGDVLSQQEEMPPAVSAVLDSTTELKRFFFPFIHSHAPPVQVIYSYFSVRSVFCIYFMKYTLK